MPPKLIKTPVAIIVFNRPDHTAQLLEKLSNFKFSQLIFIADGPRNKKDDVDCEEVRRLVQQVDWACGVDYVFSDVNLGCKNRVVSGLNYVFEKYEEAIVLEDDCIPADSFFDFCEAMLDRYRYDDRILMACGTVLVEQKDNPFSYFYSHIPHIWGWASWRNRWKKYDQDIITYEDFYKLNELGAAFPEPFCWNLCQLLKKIREGYLDTWDAQMTYLAVSENMLSVFPNSNLIKNIGFDGFATHTKEFSVLSNLDVGAFDKNIKHPSVIVPLRKADSDRMLLEGFSGHKFKRLLMVLGRKNGVRHVLYKALNKIGLTR